MTDSNRVFQVAQIGLQGADLVAMERILSMSQKRTRRYQLVEFKAGQPWDILLVRAGDPLARSLQFSAEAEGGTALVTVGTEEEVAGLEFACATPLLPAKLLQVLDQVTVSVLHYAPELTIGDEVAASIDIDAVKTRSQQRQRYKHRALVVDDSEPVRKQLGMSLDMLGVSADFAENGDEAFLLLQKEEYDIIFLDVVMPGVSGFDVCKTIKKSPRTKDVPVVMLTGKTSKMDRVKGAMVGCQGYLTKPLDNEAFQAAVEQWLPVQ